KRIRQWATWAGTTIPALVDPYLTLLRVSRNLREMPRIPSVSCSCDDTVKRKTLSVLCVHFESIEKIEIHVCECQPAPLQLLNRGMFPCAPCAPSLAVDLRVLDFVTTLFVRMPPNVTAWCDAVEVFLDGRGYKLDTRNSIRRRFSNTLLWYGSLQSASKIYVTAYLEETRTGLIEEGTIRDTRGGEECEERQGEREERRTRTTIEDVDDVDELVAAGVGLGLEDPVLEEVQEGASDGGNDSEGSTEAGRGSAGGSTSDDGKKEGGAKRPSEYLRQRCPLCFGGQISHDPDVLTRHYSADVIVCLDACFTQKRRKNRDGRRDPPRAHPESVFIPDDDVRAMRDFVEERRGPTKGGDGGPTPAEGAEDGYEAGLRVPNSVLNECGDSFRAADEKREAASTQFFGDTGLMALLCRHDRVLWLINMNTAGERQYYALALINRLFQHLPPTMTAGILYDIGCQLHRSCVKWDFLAEIRDRITFGISVFHAYGHQWACQVIYHPRKCVGFGLTDGEGCERFWSAIKKLIPVLRVSGYHQRLYVLDTQVKHLDDKSLHGLGGWLSRRWLHCQKKKEDAQVRLEGVDIADETLRREWEAQVEEQTRPAPRRSKNKGKLAVETILALQKSESEYKEAEAALEAQLLGEYDEDVDAGDIAFELSNVRSKIANISANIQRKIAALGATERSNLRRLATNDYVRVRMNARALKKRIRDRLRQRKFELERLERAYRHTVNEKNLRTHAESSVKRREPGILALARAYNKLCDELVSLIKRRKGLPGAVAPARIQREGLFKLDVDDDIWQDIGLDDDENGNGEIPLWLGDDNVREGIRARLELDRCIEEEARLGKERCAMQEWMLEEWMVLKEAKSDADGFDEDMLYQLKLRKEYLLRLCLTWQKMVGGIVPSQPMPESWGPTLEELIDTAVLENTASYEDPEGEDDGDYAGYGEEDEEEEDDSELLEVAEESALADAYKDE
ncbi:hypothetical protein PLICRDRAFT_76994, partial [Plicaturopsis crispa FD-325 SS-3]